MGEKLKIYGRFKVLRVQQYGYIERIFIADSGILSASQIVVLFLL